MILGTGIDIVDVSRFMGWSKYSKERLLKVFSDYELSFASQKSEGCFAQYLAVRFAAKEALFKALSASLVNLGLTKNSFSFQFARQYIEVISGEWEVPIFKINWHAFEEKVGSNFSKDLKTHLSLSHEKEYATAVVIISKD